MDDSGFVWCKEVWLVEERTVISYILDYASRYMFLAYARYFSRGPFI